MTEETLFYEALAKPPHERAEFLAAACAGQPELRAAVESLLAAHEASGNPLDRPPSEVAGTLESQPGIRSPHDPVAQASATTDYPSHPASGMVLAGRYKLVEKIGEGGMGSVFMAQQLAPVKRLVAVKIIKPGMDSREVLARFEAERQALALMDHPNIARVLDAGATESGRPFFAMELVKGTPITQYCDSRKLTPRERLNLFLPVCQAIQHAHQKGIIHRDIKPSNVLVALYDDRPVPKVIDFGLAKATGQALTEKTLITGFGALVGTPEYMSPEQANLNNLDVDTRSDIYSLGVLLYELHTGSTPVDRRSLADAAVLEVLRIVREVEAPRPSTKLSSSANLPGIAANRSTDPARLTKLLRGELDCVLMKVLDKDRGRRYETANGLARDIERYLADELVEARPPSTSYRLRKFVRRHKVEVIAGALVLLALLAGIAGTTTGFLQARAAQGRAQAGERLAGSRLGQVAEEKKYVEDEKEKGDFARRQAQRQLALSYMDRGVNELKFGDRRQGYAFLGQAYHAASEVADLRASARALLGAWDLDLPRLIIHNGVVFSVAFSPDGRRFVTASGRTLSDGGGEARLWETATGKPLAQSMKHDAPVIAASFNPNGTKIATISGNTLRFWDAATGKPLAPSIEESAGLNAFAFSPDGTKIVAGGLDATARIWDAATREPLGTPMKHGSGVNVVAFSPDGTKIVTASLDATARLWDGATGKPLGTPMKHDRQVFIAAFSPDGTRIATVSGMRSERQGKVRLWDAATCRLLGEQLILDDKVRALAFSPDGTKLVAVTGRGPDNMEETRLLDAIAGKPLGPPMKLGRDVEIVVYSPDSADIAAASGRDNEGRGEVSLWEAATNMPLGTRLEHERDIMCIAFSPDGAKIATASRDKTARLWSSATGKSIGAPMQHAGLVNSVAFSRDGRKIVTAAGVNAANKGEMRLWDAATGKPFGVPRMHDEELLCAAFSPDGTKIATADGTAQLWDATTVDPMGSPMKYEDAAIVAVAFSPDGTKIATAGGNHLRNKGEARLWDVANGKPIGPPMAHDDAVMSVAFSPDGRKIATASWDRTARLWDAATCKSLRTLAHDAVVISVAFSPDGTKIATACADKSAWLWDTSTGEPLGAPMPHDAAVLTVAFSPDDSKIAIAGEDKTARLWRAPRPLPDDPAWITAYVESASGYKQDADGTLRPLSPEAAAADWAEIIKLPAWLEYRKTVLEGSRRDWHEAEATHWEAEKKPFAAAFHLKWLLDRSPQDSALRRRLEAVRGMKPKGT
jgi:eukaryotic-like serine/threonine-protein kinase